MWTTDAGVRFELSPWRARRVIAQAKEIARRRRDGQASLPGGVLHDLQRMARFARPVKNMVHQPTGNQLRVFEAQLPDGMFRMMTQSRPGLESVLGVTFQGLKSELEQEAQYEGHFSIRWMVNQPVSLKWAVSNANGSAPRAPGVYLIFRKGGEKNWVLKYVGKSENLRKRLSARFEYSRQHDDADHLGVMYGVVLGPKGGQLHGGQIQEGISAAEHALIRTLNPRILTNQSSINAFSARQNRLIVDFILPDYIKSMGLKLHSSYDALANKVAVEARQSYESVFR
ncbi:MAG TPA: hypothetical protein VFF26_14640 [Gallionella sp.]|nr:hypothetical protein [Gallionella sp.]